MSKCKRESDDTSEVHLLGILGCRPAWQSSASPCSEALPGTALVLPCNNPWWASSLLGAAQPLPAAHKQPRTVPGLPPPLAPMIRGSSAFAALLPLIGEQCVFEFMPDFLLRVPSQLEGTWMLCSGSKYENWSSQRRSALNIHLLSLSFQSVSVGKIRAEFPQDVVLHSLTN